MEAQVKAQGVEGGEKSSVKLTFECKGTISALTLFFTSADNP